MEVVYKIFFSALQERDDCSGYAPAQLIKCPDFTNDIDAEAWLQKQKIEPIPENSTEIRRYYFIHKTFKF